MIFFRVFVILFLFIFTFLKEWCHSNKHILIHPVIFLLDSLTFTLDSLLLARTHTTHIYYFILSRTQCMLMWNLCFAMLSYVFLVPNTASSEGIIQPVVLPHVPNHVSKSSKFLSLIYTIPMKMLYIHLFFYTFLYDDNCTLFFII